MSKKISANIENLPDLELVKQGKKLPVMELFYTLQGEGRNAGVAAIFLRLSGCDVGCHWCDVKESWIATDHSLMSIEEITDKVLEYNCENIVITGGEPLMYDLTLLTKMLQDNGMKTMIETSGAYPLSGSWHWICVSPKKTKRALNEVLLEADELKVIVFNKSDFKWAEEHAELVSNKAQFYLQVEWSKKDQLSMEIVEYIKRNPSWKLSLQTHKYIDIP